MGWDPACLPDAILAKIDKSDRAVMGRAGMTSAEAAEKARAGEEDRLQEDIRRYLRLHEIEFINPPMRRRSALPPGWTDFTFVYRGVPIACEAKTESGQLEDSQRAMLPKLERNGWRVLIAHSVADLQALFRQIDAEVSK